ncbi:MAG: hypothetical protein OI74_01115 [Gammaproteobacteria bacterium (ex Lamellibrachia satsuma)]|nr:MAG: hypothetical protein HPY30_18310 [Gammaproteobacteria bacterium (ex Lamellibrachia satsuma)]RRS35984.1 MAG: hypothetical protein OI74_01115 [Gammaproteobacteria bacterium (ex Lamellibrachia satsuma)]RRS36576.1 MAG: hypothetical protein NV67_06785 [Gammaproteobacteria bacterium (ex Lamellibrachia satsuma)]
MPDVPVAKPAGMVLLKIIAWTDRTRDMRRKDAIDIACLLSTYELIPEVSNALYDSKNTEIMETHGWDITQACAFLLSQHTAGDHQADQWGIESVES